MKLAKKIIPILSAAAIGAGIAPIALTSCVPNKYSWTYVDKKEPKLNFDPLPKQDLTLDECLRKYLFAAGAENKMFTEDIFYSQFKERQSLLEGELNYTILSCKFTITNFNVVNVNKNFTSRISFGWTEEITVKESAAVGGEQHKYTNNIVYNKIPVNVAINSKESLFNNKICLYFGDAIATAQQLDLANDKNWSVSFAQYMDDKPLPASDGSKQNGVYNCNNYSSFKFKPATEIGEYDSVWSKVFGSRFIHVNYLDQITVKQ